MAYNDEHFLAALPLIRKLPPTIHWDVWGETLMIQCPKQADVKQVISVLGPAIWTKQYTKEIGTWQYSTTALEVKVMVYAVREAPLSCTPIKELRKVTKRIPTAFSEEEVEEEVVVGWDCSHDGDEATDDAL